MDRSLAPTLPLAIVAVALACQPRPGAPEYRAEVRRARLAVLDTPELRVWDLDLGNPTPGQNSFLAAVKNNSGSVQYLALDLRATPGLWYRPNWQRQYRFRLRPHEVRVVEAEYEFPRLTIEGALRVRMWRTSDSAAPLPLEGQFLDESYAVGAGNPAAYDPDSTFDQLETAHLDVYAWKGSAAARDIRRIGEEREAALEEVARELEVPFMGRLRLVFYPDSATKTGETGHVGAGWAWGSTVVEIYGEVERLDPYHEIAHVVARELGQPPALLSEGYATYVSERLGADALALLGHPGRTVDDAACDNIRAGMLIPLDTLIRFTEIGSAASNPSVAYPEAASVVKHLIEQYGVEAFRDAYASLRSGDDSATAGANVAALDRLYGRSLGQLEREWRRRIGCPPPRPARPAPAVPQPGPGL
jgi:hypothetical protein